MVAIKAGRIKTRGKYLNKWRIPDHVVNEMLRKHTPFDKPARKTHPHSHQGLTCPRHCPVILSRGEP